MAILVIHGGAGTVSDRYQDAYREGLKAAADVGHRELQATGDPVKAVIAAVSAMELNEKAFNAGVGGAPTREGRVELDACVMAGDGSAGAVAAVTNSRNPVRLAEKVRTSTPHVILAGEGAERLEDDPVPNEALLNERMREELERWRRQGSDQPGRGTVGALALSDDGRLAAATSTGGILAQYAGRLGDTPCPAPAPGATSGRRCPAPASARRSCARSPAAAWRCASTWAPRPRRRCRPVWTTS